jgi:hypothetical protein
VHPTRYRPHRLTITPDRRRKSTARGTSSYRHLLKRRDVECFLEIVPDWHELSTGLNAIVLAPHGDCMGWHEPGVVHVCAWEEELW